MQLTQPTTHLLDCNEDVLRLIMDCLSQGDLRRACLAHPQLRYLAEPPLYSKIELYYDEPYDEQTYWTSHPITSLIRTLLRRQELATLVRSLSCLTVGHWGKLRVRRVVNIPVCNTKDIKEALCFVEKTGLPYRDTWMEELRQGTLDAHLAVLLSQLSRLRSLYLSQRFSQKIDLIALVLRSMLCESHLERPIPGISSTGLHQLHTVSLERDIHPHRALMARNTETILPLFYLPSIKDLSISIDSPPTPALPWPTPQPPLAPGLRSLRLCHIRESHLGPLLAAAPNLHSLHWQWYYDPDHEDQSNTPTVNLDLLMPALDPLRDTLATLTTPTYCAYSTQPFVPFPLRIQGTMKPLINFHRLTTLVIPLVFFTGFALPVQKGALADCLPPSLEDLTLTDGLYVDIDTQEPWDETGHSAAIRDWLAGDGGGGDVRVLTPRLRRLVLVLQGEDDEICKEELEVRDEIKELARAVGVELDRKSVYSTWMDE